LVAIKHRHPSASPRSSGRNRPASVSAPGLEEDDADGDGESQREGDDGDEAETGTRRVFTSTEMYVARLGFDRARDFRH
jgi:hypothetical protein